MGNIEEIRESLMKQLQTKKADVAFMREQVESYCQFADLEAKMWTDIAKNGKTITVISSSTGKKAEKENPAIKMAVMASKQKLEILKRLGLSVDTVIDDTVTDEDKDI